MQRNMEYMENKPNLTMVQATAVFIVDLLVSPAESYNQLQLNYQTTYQHFYMKLTAVYNPVLFITDTRHVAA